MQLDLDARAGRPRRRRGFRLALLAGLIVSGVAVFNITLTAGARGAAEAQQRASRDITIPERDAARLTVPSAEQSAAQLAAASGSAGAIETSEVSVTSATINRPDPQAERSRGAADTADRPAAPQKTAGADDADTGVDAAAESDADAQKPAEAELAVLAPRDVSISQPQTPDQTMANAEAETDSNKASEPSSPSKAKSAGGETSQEADWESLEVRSGDSLARLFRRADLSSKDVHDVLEAHKRADELRRLYPGDVIKIKLSSDGKLLALRHDLSGRETLQLERNGAGYEGEILANELERRIQHGSAVIRRSLFDAGNRVGLSDSLLLDLAEVFRWDIDFALDIRNGDAFTVIYEAFYRDGDKVRNGDILAAEFVNRGEAHRAVRYSNDAQQADYYDPQGRSMRKAFLRSPVDFTRVSSNFNPNRLHPTLGERRPHMGTDYAASPGTPIKATGNGQVIHRGWKGGYGRTVVVQHGGRYTTLYAHMSRYRASVTAGDHVSQGQVIGYVGSSGRSTGPHLHYEFRVNGEHRNPRTVNLPNAKPIPDHLRQDFEDQTQSRLAELDMYSRFRLAAQGELAR